jgi:hypothetical protein
MAAVEKAGVRAGTPAASRDCVGAPRRCFPWRAAMRAGRALHPELLLALLLALPCDGKNPPPGGQQGGKMPIHPPLTQQSSADQETSIDSADALTTRRRLHAYYLEQQKSMVKDTDKLLKLAADLNAEVSSAHHGTLTADERHKVAEIEKLARRVKEKMSEPVPAGIGDQQPSRIFTH